MRLPAPQRKEAGMPQTYEIPIIMKVTAVDEAHAMTAAECTIEAVRKFNGTELELAPAIDIGLGNPFELKAVA